MMWCHVSEPDNRGTADGQVQSSPQAGVRHADHSTGHQPTDAECQSLSVPLHLPVVSRSVCLLLLKSPSVVSLCC